MQRFERILVTATLVVAAHLPSEIVAAPNDDIEYRVVYDVTMASTVPPAPTAPIPSNYLQLQLRRFGFSHNGGSEIDGNLGDPSHPTYGALDAPRSMDGLDCYITQLVREAGANGGLSLAVVDNAHGNDDRVFLVKLLETTSTGGTKSLERIWLHVKKNGRLARIRYRHTGDASPTALPRNQAKVSEDVMIEGTATIPASECILAHRPPPSLATKRMQGERAGGENVARHSHDVLGEVECDADEDACDSATCSDQASPQCMEARTMHNYGTYKHCTLSGGRVVHCGLVSP